jgi:molecular chaperone DnaK
MRTTLGIDLGTTTSVAASNAKVLSLRDENEFVTLMPSVVAFLPNGGAAVGNAARDRKPVDPKNTLYSCKRLMGEAFVSSAVSQFRNQYPHDLMRGADGGVEISTRAGAIRPEEVAALIASHLCMRAALHPASVPTVVTVPSAFRDSARTATMLGLEQAGFTHVHLIEEPVATALAYLERASLRYAAIYDLGGGTFDFAVIDCSGYPFRVLGHGGDPYLGGDDVDLALADMLVDGVLRSHGWDLRSDRITFARLIMLAEKAKCALATQPVASLDVTEVDDAAPSDVGLVELDRTMLESAALPLVQRSFVICDEVLREVGLKARDIQAVFLAGGSTKLPMLANMVSAYFGRRVRSDLNPEHVVALGASMAAARPDLRSLLDR